MNPEDYLAATLRRTQELYEKHLERELTIEGFTQRLSQLIEVGYLTFVLSSFPVALYSLDRAISREQIYTPPAKTQEIFQSRQEIHR
jgi:hypothetical protein